jgi:hypothetical protein
MGEREGRGGEGRILPTWTPYPKTAAHGPDKAERDTASEFQHAVETNARFLLNNQLSQVQTIERQNLRHTYNLSRVSSLLK